MSYPLQVSTGGSLCLCVFVFQLFLLECNGLGVLEIQKKMIETQRHKDTKVIKSLINIEIIKLYTAPRNLFGNGELYQSRELSLCQKTIFETRSV
jgi:hypothetical protein